MRRQRHAADPSDESRRYQFPEGTDVALEERLGGDVALARGGWHVDRCDFPGPTDRRTIGVELTGPGRRALRVRFHAINYVATGTTAADAPDERYPAIVPRLASRLATIAENHPAGRDQWIDT